MKYEEKQLFIANGELLTTHIHYVYKVLGKFNFKLKKFWVCLFLFFKYRYKNLNFILKNGD